MLKLECTKYAVNEIAKFSIWLKVYYIMWLGLRKLVLSTHKFWPHFQNLIALPLNMMLKWNFYRLCTNHWRFCRIVVAYMEKEIHSTRWKVYFVWIRLVFLGTYSHISIQCTHKSCTYNAYKLFCQDWHIFAVTKPYPPFLTSSQLPYSGKFSEG